MSIIKVEKEMDRIILTNEKGDTYTSKSEALMDFLFDIDNEFAAQSQQQGNPVWQPESMRQAMNLLKEYEQWEADIIGCNEMWWPSVGKDALPLKIYEKMLELQTKRNEILYGEPKNKICGVDCGCTSSEQCRFP